MASSISVRLLSQCVIENDHSDVHIGLESSTKLQETIREFLKAPSNVFNLTNTLADRKRNLRNIATPSSADTRTKHWKVGSATEY